jgi:hypothetical protein
MLAKVFALAMTVMIGALALEVVFGVHLGISRWVHGVLGASQMGLIPPL